MLVAKVTATVPAGSLIGAAFLMWRTQAEPDQVPKESTGLCHCGHLSQPPRVPMSSGVQRQAPAPVREIAAWGGVWGTSGSHLGLLRPWSFPWRREKGPMGHCQDVHGMSHPNTE